MAIKVFKGIEFCRILLFLSFFQCQLGYLYCQEIKAAPILPLLPPRLAYPESFIQRFDISTNNFSLCRRHYPFIVGQGKVVSIKERHFNPTDPDIRNRNFSTPFTPQTIDLHATEMATIITGIGNTGYNGFGAASRAKATSASFANLMPEPDTYYRSNNITVQNHSYGTGIENIYAEDASAYDLTTWLNPGLIHVFSAGNQGTSTPDNGLYAGIPGFSNLTGSFKMSKNSLSVGATDSFYRIETLSSRGPAYDGRLKPELVAFGVDGSSGSAALVSGAALLLQQLLSEQTGLHPPASLIKSLLITGANRRHQAGPDYVYGYGHLDAFNSLNIAVNKQYRMGIITKGNNQNLTLSIPPGTASIKISLCWSDTAAKPGSAKALTNDLDLFVADPGGNFFLPWGLSVFPHIDSLKKAASRTRDSLNTTEQVTIPNPIAGQYTIYIKAYSIATLQQSWSISWDIQKADSFFFTHPASSTPIESSKTGILRWSHTFPEGKIGKLEYRNTENSTWISIYNNVNISQGFQLTSLPAITGLIQYRMTIDNNTFLSDTIFIAKPPQFSIGYVCADTVLIEWKPVAGISKYRIYALGDTIMQPVGITSDTIFKLPLNQSKNDLVTIAAQSSQDPSFEFRAPSKAISFQGVGCYFINFLSQWDKGAGLLSFSLGTTYHIKTALLQKQVGGRFETIQTINPVNSTSYLFTDSNLLTGANTYRAVLMLNDGRTVMSDLQTLIQPNTRGWWVYPNPVKRNGRLNIINRWRDSDELLVDIYDTKGRISSIKVAALIDNSFAITNLAPGVYFLVFHDGKSRLGFQKLVIIP